MKTLLCSLLIIYNIQAQAQEWVDYQVDSVLTVSLPDNYFTMDTLGQHLALAQVENGLVMITSFQNKGDSAINASSESELLEAYVGFRKGFVNSQQGEFVEEKIVDIKGLKFARFSMRATTEGEVQLRHCLAGFISEKTYALSFWEVESMSQAMTPVREKFFSSVKLAPGLTLQNQLNTSLEATPAYKLGYKLGKAFSYLAIASLIIVMVIVVRKLVTKKKTAPRHE